MLQDTQQFLVRYRSNDTLRRLRPRLESELGYFPEGAFQAISPDGESLQPISESCFVQDVVNTHGYVHMEGNGLNTRVGRNYPSNGRVLPKQASNELSVDNMNEESTAYSGNRFFDATLFEHMDRNTDQSGKNVAQVGSMGGKSKIHVGDFYGYDGYS